MASALKRKRGPGETVETLKRVKSVKDKKNPIPVPQFSQTGWEAAFNPPPKANELIPTNGINGNGIHVGEGLDSPEALDYEAVLKESEEQMLDEKRQKKDRRKLLKKVFSATEPNSWKLSEPIGGRQINVDPVFTADEKFLLLANRTTIHVYSTSNSLLTRSIKLKITTADVHIVTYCLSETDPDLIWVACSDGSIYSINWTSGEGADQSWTISSTGCIHMTAASMDSGGRRRDVVFTTEVRKDGGWRITANELARPNDPFETAARTIYTSNGRINFLKTASEGSVIVAASEKRVLIGSLRSTEYNTIDKMKYEFRVFESTDFISSLDAKVSARDGTSTLGKSVLKRLLVVDVVIGDVKGSIFVHNDLLGNLAQSQDDKATAGISLIPRRLHWHRKEVCTVKWSLDGNYIISGGTETVLVLWQLDTGKKQFLPHMSATIRNVVVSPSGTSYGVKLADNSTMVLSAVELKPTANIAGIQTSVIDFDEVSESRVHRLEEERDELPFMQRTPAVVNPINPSRLLVGVSQTQEVSPTNPLVSSIPYLQSFGLFSGHNISRQALTRSNETNVNITPTAHRISEPRITHMKLSHDGHWLATVDEWTPPKRDVDFMAYQGKSANEERQRRREVFLKFWQLESENDTWELVSRIDAPHSLSGTSSGAGSILDLAADPVFLQFSTIGEDGAVRIWATKTRKRDGVIVRGKNNQPLRNWDCLHAISVGKQELHSDLTTLENTEGNGCVAYSDDGSLLAAVCGSRGTVHLLDPESGKIRTSKTGLSDGDIVKVDFLGPDLIVLSNQLLAYDLVSDEVRYGIQLGYPVSSLSIAQKMEMMHLAVDRKSQTFAIALPSGFERQHSLLSTFSELVVFSQDDTEPVLREEFLSPIISLLPAVGSDGFLILDSTAEIRTISRDGSQSVLAQAQPTSALQLDEETSALEVEEADGSNGDLLRLIDGEAEVVSTLKTGIEEDDETPVVRQQQLTAIFDIGPSFALPSMEEIFYQVAGLFSSQPLAQSVS